MPIKFETRAHEACYGIVQIWLKLMFRDATEVDPDRPVFFTRIDDARVHTEIRAWENPFGEDDAIIRNVAYIVRDVDTTLALTRYLVERSGEAPFGGFGMDNQHNVFFGHSIVGSTCDRLELRSSVATVADSALRFHNDIIARTGGKSALNE